MKTTNILSKKNKGEKEFLKNQNTSDLDLNLKVSDISFKKGSYNKFKNSLFNRFSEEPITNNKERPKIFGNNIYIKNPFKCGNIYCLFYKKNEPLITLGPQFYFSLLLIFIVNLTNIFALLFLYNKLHYLFHFPGLILYLFQSYSHLYTMLINPGIPKKKWYFHNNLIKKITKDPIFNSQFNFEKYQICKKCSLLIDKNLNVVHCEICNICCEEYDHHCPWIGKCIGKNNNKTFGWFLLASVLFFIYIIILCIIVLIISYL